MALGAGRAAIARLILRETLLLLSIGALVGALLALAGGPRSRYPAVRRAP